MRKYLSALGIVLILFLSCKKDTPVTESLPVIIEDIEETTEYSSSSEIIHEVSKATEYHNYLYNFIYSDPIQLSSSEKFIDNGGAAGKMINEFPGGRCESVSGSSFIEIYDDNVFLNYGYTADVFIGKNKNEVIKYLGTDYTDNNYNISYNDNSLNFYYDANDIVTKIFLTPIY